MKDNIGTWDMGNKRPVLLGLIGSPRKLGNCEVFVKEISRQIKMEHSLRLIRLPSLKILHCKACYGCIMGNRCPLEDDMKLLLTEIVAADAVLIASPVYYFNAHSIFKKILDRGFLFYDVLERVYGKPCVLVGTYGIEERVGTTSQTLMAFASFLGLNIKANMNILAALPGEILIDEKNRRAASQMAEALFADQKITNTTGCPYCCCDIVRLERDHIVCTLCHGHFRIDENGARVKEKDGGILGTPSHMLLHREWLKGMKARFLERKREIISAIKDYKEDGEWVIP